MHRSFFPLAVFLTSRWVFGYSDEICRHKKATYPKYGAIWPIPTSGEPSKSCYLKCPDARSLSYTCYLECGEEGSGFHVIPTKGFTVALKCHNALPSDETQHKALAIELITARLNRSFSNPSFPQNGSNSMEKAKINKMLSQRTITLQFMIDDCRITVPRLQNPYNERWPTHPTGTDTLATAQEHYVRWPSDEKYKITLRLVPQPTANEFGDVITELDKKIYIEATKMAGAIQAISTIVGMIEGFKVQTFSSLMDDALLSPATLLRRSALLSHIHKGSDLLYGISFDDQVIVDFPKYPVRGVVLDIARGFVPKSELFTLIESLHLSKINTIQLHGTDDQSFAYFFGTEKVCNDLTGTCTRVPWNEVVVNLNTRRDDKSARIKTMNLTEYVHGTNCYGGQDYNNAYCAGTVAPSAAYDRTDVAEILTYAWLHGISIIFDLSSPTHARSWGVGEILECDRISAMAMANGSDDIPFSTAYNIQCYPDNLSGDPKYENESLLMCHGHEYQHSLNCAQQLCGPLNIQLFEEHNTTELDGVETEDLLSMMKNPRVFEIFNAITNSLDTEINMTPIAFLLTQRYPELALSSDRLIEYFQVANDQNVRPKYINGNDILHLGLDLVNGTCLDGNSDRKSTPKTAQAVELWLRLVVNKTKMLGWRSIGWNDIVKMFPELKQKFSLEWGIIPQVWSSSGGYYKEFRELASDYTTFIWSAWESLYLDCGLSNTGSAALKSWCRPTKSYWDLLNTDPDAFYDLALPYYKANLREDTIRSMGAIAPLWGEQQTIFNISERINPRISIIGGAMWRGRGSMKSKPPFRFRNDVQGNYDFSDIVSEDFNEESLWLKWSATLAHLCFPITLPRAAWCYLNHQRSELAYCRPFAKSLYQSIQ